MKPRYISSLNQIDGFGVHAPGDLSQITDTFAFRANEYYLSLINWQDTADPIRRLIIPCMEELEEWGRLDPSSEGSYTVTPGLQHKYRETALLLVSDLCGGLCRYCFRKRLFINDGREVKKDVSEGIAYIRQHPEITNVLLTGGDPLILPTEQTPRDHRRAAADRPRPDHQDRVEDAGVQPVPDRGRSRSPGSHP